MTVLFEYPDGSPVCVGDLVQIDRGSTLARVDSILNTHQIATSHGMQDCGVIVDAQPKGVVFLSQALLRDDPLQFVRRGPGEVARIYGVMVFALATLLIVPATYSLFSAIYSAFSTGEVLVISLGRTETYRRSVSWPDGWARFIAPILLVLSLFMSDGSRGITQRWWLAAGGTAVALLLLGFSAWFTSVNGALAFAGLAGFIAIAAYIDRKIGRRAALSFVVVGWIAIIWKIVAVI